MAAKKSAQVETKGGGLKKAISFLGMATPFLIRLVQMLRDNPEVWDYVKEQLEKLRRHDKATPCLLYTSPSPRD